MSSRPINLPEELHPDTAQLVVEFAEALAQKLRANEVKHGFGNDWLIDLWEEKCRQDLLTHLAKGDPRDVAAYCAFMWRRGWKTIASAA